MGSAKKSKSSVRHVEEQSRQEQFDQASEPTREEPFDKAVLKHLPQGPDRGIFWDVVCSIFEPGVNSGLMLVIHGIFSSLLLLQLLFIFTVDAKSIHLWILFILSAALYPSLIIFVQEIERVKKSAETDKAK